MPQVFTVSQIRLVDAVEQHTALRNANWTPSYAFMDGPDEIGAYGPGSPSWAVVDGELYVTFIQGKSHYFSTPPGQTTPDQDQRDGYRDEYNGIFHIKADHTFERVVTFPDIVSSAWGICAHNHTPYPIVGGTGTSEGHQVGRLTSHGPDGTHVSGLTGYTFTVTFDPLPAGTIDSTVTHIASVNYEVGQTEATYIEAFDPATPSTDVYSGQSSVIAQGVQFADPDTYTLRISTALGQAFAESHVVVTRTFDVVVAGGGSGDPALYGKIGWDYDGWVMNPTGGNDLYYGTPRSIKGELVFYQGDDYPYCLVQETREIMLFRTSNGAIERHDEATWSGNAFNGDYHDVANIEQDENGDIWVHFQDSPDGAPNHGGTSLFAKYPNLNAGTTPTLEHSIYDIELREINGGTYSMLSDADAIYVQLRQDDYFAGGPLDIWRVDKVTGAAVKEYTDPGTDFGSGRGATMSTGGFFKWQGKIYTQCYASAFRERQSDGTWITETETPDYTTAAGAHQLVPLKLDWQGYAIRGISDKFIWQVAYDDRYLVDSSNNFRAYNPELNLTQGVFSRHQGVTNRANPFFWLYIDGTAGPAARQRLIGGPYQPPIAAKQQGTSGDVLYKPGGDGS